MNRRLLSPLLFTGVLATLAFAAAAQTATPAVEADASAQAQAADDASAATALDPNATPEIDRNCLRYTGSRIGTNYSSTRSARDSADKKTQRCVAATGRVYSREDIERTGEIDIADALRKLDPAIR